MLELKWPMLRPNAHTFNFERADAILDFARDNDLTMRGHALAWYYDIPDWTKQIKDGKGVERPMSTTSAPSSPITRTS